MNLKKLNIENYHVSTWSGGETKQLFLSPVQGSYQVGNFDFRVSSASVKVAETHFTCLPGYERLIMSIDHPLTLCHQSAAGGKKIELTPYTAHHFLGSDQTTSFGKCQDMNLIYRRGLIGKLQACSQNASIRAMSGEFVLVYALEELRVLLNQGTDIRSSHLKAGSSIVIERVTESCQLTLTAKTRTEKPIAVVASISAN
ncbi:HutD family protein [Vagococcus sp. BWB3-3]|uniref:HutD family protein n=1 Tax=Vagococcus allomyrinae TaxID=2794353 RepID=A0A940P998_9ENTE|nr:HutD family protein [Vagococcus allomyrinae]MBP1040809.1 HutD family protein [Vagococcus allomyrinae]